jgi:hypothetical protein
LPGKNYLRPFDKPALSVEQQFELLSNEAYTSICPLMARLVEVAGTQIDSLPARADRAWILFGVDPAAQNLISRVYSATSKIDSNQVTNFSFPG